jgi:L-ascorbate metabolism protein UlaG (beta-lactamase superfamily)
MRRLLLEGCSLSLILILIVDILACRFYSLLKYHKKGAQTMKFLSAIVLLGIGSSLPLGGEPFEKDTIGTSVGDLIITFIGHGSLMITFDNKNIQIDAYSKLADYSQFPKADIIFLTHHHGDHLDLEALQHVQTDSSIVVLTELCTKQVEGGIIMKNGDVKTIEGIKVEAVPAYNIVHKRENGEFYHPKGEGNGYILTFGDKRIYIAGDTENTPEMKALESIDYAFLPMNVPYTMTPEMVADAVKAFKPKVLYPYHYGDTDTSKLIELLKDFPDTEVRIRKMK